MPANLVEAVTKPKILSPPHLEEVVVAVADLRPHPRNYRVHPPDQVAHLAASITQHSQYRRVVVARDNTILAGHGVTQAAQLLGLAEVRVARLDLAPDDPRALKLLAGDNEVGHLAEVDDRALTELLKEVRDVDVDGLVGTGFDDAMLANLAMVTRPAAEIEDFNAAAEWLGLPDFNPADPVFKVVVSCETEADRDRLVAELGLVANKPAGGKRAWSAWWPPRENVDAASVRFGG